MKKVIIEHRGRVDGMGASSSDRDYVRKIARQNVARSIKVDELDILRLVHLYDELTSMFPHPFDWMHGLRRPAFWRLSRRRGHEAIVKAFNRHGWFLEPEFEYRFRNTPDTLTVGLDAGGSILAQMAFGLDLIVDDKINNDIHHRLMGVSDNAR